MFQRKHCMSPGEFVFGPSPLLPDDGGSGGGDGGGGAGDGRAGNGDAGKTFNEADVERIVKDRLNRDRGDRSEIDRKAAEFDKLQEAQASDLEKATKKAASDAEAATRAELMSERALDRVEVAAAKTFADPTDARLRLRDRASEFIKDGQIDGKAVQAAVDQLLKDAPHLAAAGNGTGRPRRDDAQGGNDGNRTKAQAGLDEARRRGFIKD